MSTSTPTLHVTGDAYSALFYVPPGRLFLDGNDANAAHVHALPVGVEYIYRAIRAVCDPEGVHSDSTNKSPSDVDLCCSQGDPKTFVSTFPARAIQYPIPFARYEIAKPEVMDGPIPGKKLPLLRTARSEALALQVTDVIPSYRRRPTVPDGSKAPVQVFWFGEMPMPLEKDGKPVRREKPNSVKCSFQIQVGLPHALGKSPPDNMLCPGDFAKPTHARFLVVNIGEVSEAHRVRRSLSYEAIAVDLLRMLRGGGENGTVTQELIELGMVGEDAPHKTYLIVRLSNAAVFVYHCNQLRRKALRFEESSANSIPFGGDIQESAWLLCHQDECAPLSQPELGQMAGYTGFVSAQLGAAFREWESNIVPGATITSTALGAIQRSLVWQRAAFRRGCLHLLFKNEGKHWKPTSGSPRDARMAYDNMFKDIIGDLISTLRVEGIDPNLPDESKPLVSRLHCFDPLADKKVLQVRVDIDRAVAHRTPWFMAWSVAKIWWMKQHPTKEFQSPESAFRQMAVGWLVKKGDKIASPGDDPKIPIVRIGDAELTDRREVEDFLAIHQTLQIYANSPQEHKPLNIAVFGAPGSGKSFAVKQVVKHLSETHRGVFKDKPLTFNLSQFTRLSDLPDSLHLVRNECLSGEIPIVFFDEFDSSFDGQPFGWLKFFLAPMQDGEFYHAGQTFKMGRAVFVFAGGVNRSFEELNGRVRNLGFCEAKGPDFISRLKAHLNVQGINEPEEKESDQFRYLLRRGVLLRDIVRRKLNLPKQSKHGSLLQESVAHALLKIERFKHGVRSLEAIINMCSARAGHPIGPSDLPSLDQLHMHVDASKLLHYVDEFGKSRKGKNGL